MTGLSLFASTLALTAALAVGPLRPAIEVRDWDDDGRVVQTMSLEDGGTFSLQFTHSMYGGTVTERFRVLEPDAGAFERSTVQTENGGAAEYYAPLGNFHREGAATWSVDVDPMRLPQLLVSAQQIGNPTIVSGNNRLALDSILPEGHVAELVPVYH